MTRPPDSDGARFRRLMEAVGEALERKSGEREGVLAQALAGEPALLEEARALLAEANASSRDPATARMEQVLGAEAVRAVGGESPVPSRIGPYEIVRKLGEGGMGLVFLARQGPPLRREVALKVVRGGLIDPGARARFEAERQALALMQHPNIARVYDAGTTDDALPYFVMELVEGLSITEYCARHRLDLDARLQLFARVCHAVQHAHQQGVIHRDLKPSNILVVDRDGRAEPKVIDFGIAKAVNGVLGDDLHTRAGSVIGTLDYMSPEQVRGDPAGIDTRADVYALGVILYRLVTGRHPFDETGLRGAGLVEAQRIILEREPPRPSTRSRPSAPGGGGPDDPAGSAPPRLRFRGELDWVVMRALEKDRERRYQSALELAQDLERYRRNEPVSAGPPSRLYRARTFVRRHRGGVAAAGLVLLALVAGAGAATVGLVRARAEERRAAAVSEFLTDMLASVRPDQRGRSVTVREVLDEARARLTAGGMSEDPETEAALSLVLGHSYESLGRYDEATELIRRSVDLRRELHGPDDRRLYASLYRLGTVLWKRGALEEALALRRELVEMTARTVGTAHPDHAEALSNLGNTYADMGDLEQAAVALEGAVDAGRSLGGETGELDLARFLNNLGTVYSDLGDFDRAIAAYEETLAIRTRLVGEETDVYAITLVNLGNALQNLDDLDGAEAALRRAVALEERIFGEDHPTTASAYSGLATVLLRSERLAEAEALARRSVAIREATASDSYRRVAVERRKLAEIFLAGGRLDAARGELDTAWAGIEGSGEGSTEWAREVAFTMSRLHALLGDDAEAALWAARAAAEPASPAR